MIENRTILQGDVLEQLKNIPSESIDCIITSPPYWGLRDYGADGQWGLESNFKQYLAKMRNFMECLKRVIKNTGTCWINLGDCYGSHRSNEEDIPIGYEKQEQEPLKGYDKSRLGIPERFYIQCIDDGWIARNHIPWIKANSMPSSVKDRFSNKWESIFFFAKEQRYYFNLDAVRVKPLTETNPFNIRVRENITGHAQAKLGDYSWTASEEELAIHNEKGERKMLHVEGQTTHGIHNKGTSGGFYLETGEWSGHPNGKNPGDIFNINPRPFPEAHFATFPIDLPLKILKCACPNQVCKKCRKSRNPVVKPTENYKKILDEQIWKEGSQNSMETGHGLSSPSNPTGGIKSEYYIDHWTDCGCNAGFEAGIVLDPFFGAGTVGMAAEKLGLNWVGIELKQEYIEIARKRLEPYQNERLQVENP